MKDITIKPRGGNVRGVATTKKRQVEEMLAIAAQSGVPAAQRDPDMMATLKVPQIGTAPRVADKTIRRLTRVERLLRSGVIERHEADACEWYAEITALAWDTTGTTANYEGGGSGGSAHAPDRLMAKRQDVAWARDDYREARNLLGGPMADAFEAVVCRNEALGPTAAAAFPDLARSQAGERMRTTLKFCANVLHMRFSGLMGWSDAPTVATPKPSAPASRVTADEPRSAAILPEIVAALEHSTVAAAAIWVSPHVIEQLRRELGARDTDSIVIGDAPVVVRDHWRWGWVLIDAGRIPLEP